MKVGFFLLKFPVASETFVLDQIVAFIDMGYEVEIVAIQKGDLIHTHEAFREYELIDKTTWLMDEQNGKIAKLQSRVLSTLCGLLRSRTWRALNVARFGAEARKLMLSSICGRNTHTLQADVFIAHFGPAGVTAAKLRELGLLEGKIATVFHGNDISQRDTLVRYTPEYKKLFSCGDLMLPISDLWADRLQKMGCPAEKIALSRMGVDLTRFSLRPYKRQGKILEIISVARLTEKKGLHVAIEACRLLKERGVAFRYHILGFGAWESRLRTLVEENQLDDVVFMSGFKPGHEVKAMLAEADLFLLPSITGKDGDMEGIPVALMEAMAVGIPVISTVHSGIPELIDAGCSGWLVPENNALALADRLQTFGTMEERELRLMLIRAREKIETEFNQHVIYQKLAHCLHTL